MCFSPAKSELVLPMRIDQYCVFFIYITVLECHWKSGSLFMNLYLKRFVERPRLLWEKPSQRFSASLCQVAIVSSHYTIIQLDKLYNYVCNPLLQMLM
jgi:hypothetical protein